MSVKIVLNQYSGKFKQNLVFQNKITLEITVTERVIFMTYTLDCIARSPVCGWPVNSILPVTDVIAVTECSLAEC